MNVAIFWYSFLLFFFCLVLHVAVWRIVHPSRHALVLLAVFFLPLPAFAPLYTNVLHGAWPDLAAIAVLHIALSCAYIQIYPAAQAFSPTLVMLILAKRSMPQGLTRAELQSRLNDDFFLGERIKDLLDAGLVGEDQGRLVLTRQGRRLIGFFIAFRASLGLEMGKG